MLLLSLGEMAPRIASDAWVAPNATLVGDVVVATSASVWFGAIVRADNTRISIGAGSNVQDGAILHSDPGFPLVIGESVTVGHRAILHGCTIGDGSLVGMGGIVLNGSVIGEACIVGAGALVTEGRRFPPRSLIVGAPAIVRRELTEDEVKDLTKGAADYREKARDYLLCLSAWGCAS